MTPDLLAALADGDEALDRGTRGPEIELDLLRNAGLTRNPLPQAYGGQGWGTTPEGALPLLEMLMALGEANLPIARIYEGHVNAVRLVIDHGSPDQCQSFADQASSGAIAGVWGADGSQPVTINNGTLTGVKAFASGLGDVSIAVLTAKTPHGLQMILADVSDPARFDYGAWDMTAMVGSRSGQFDCNGLSAQHDQRLGMPDALFAEPAFHGGIWRIIACYAGALTALAHRMRRQIEQRGSADDALTWHRLGLATMEAETARILARAACLAVETQGAAPSAIATVLFAREAVERAATRQFELIERAMGTALHRSGSANGRVMRNLRLYLRQAQLDGKLALATSNWTTEFLGFVDKGYPRFD